MCRYLCLLGDERHCCVRGEVIIKMIDPQLLEFAKTMRSNATDAENLMWQLLRAKRFMNLKFRRQHVIAPYIVDFYCHELGLVINLDNKIEF